MKTGEVARMHPSRLFAGRHLTQRTQRTQRHREDRDKERHGSGPIVALLVLPIITA
jgi:hypothetical protein